MTAYTEARLVLRDLSRRDYHTVWRAMRTFTDRRAPDTLDEVWLVEHPPVYTQGLNGRPEHILDASGIPVVATDRGGQATYHGPGQVVLYPLLDLRRRGLGVRQLVDALEDSVLQLLTEHGIAGHRQDGAPGAYVQGRKLASLGLRVRRGCSYHGLSLNVDGDLTPFAGIHPCGFQNLQMTQLRDLGIALTPLAAGHALIRHLAATLGYAEVVRLDAGLPTGIESAAPDDNPAATPART